MTVKRKARVLVCDDSRTFVFALQRLLEHDGEIEVVGIHNSAESALTAIVTAPPDLVTMDLKLPAIDGLEAVGRIMGSRPLPILVLSANLGSDGVAAAALAAGALDAIAKEDVDVQQVDSPSAKRLRRRVKLLAGAPVIHHPRSPLRGASLRRQSANGRPRRAIGICASTGGPQALARLLGDLPASFPVPIFVVQHISAGFTDGLAQWLDGIVALPVRVAQHGSLAGPGIWIAPEGAHLVLAADGSLELDRGGDVGLHRPSGDVLLRSLAERLGTGAVGVVLSGMGRDGAEGIAAIRAAGGTTIAQDAETSVVYGMPRSAAERGAERVLGLPAIAPALIALVGVPT